LISLTTFSKADIYAAHAAHATVAGPCESPAQCGFHQIFTVGNGGKNRNTRPSPARQRENPRPACLLCEIASSKCTKSGHPPVDGLHSIENTHLADAGF